MAEHKTFSDDALARTPLYTLHKELGARMVPFAGYEMPVQYPMGILKEHQHTRTRAGLFDVSHMGQVRLVGKDASVELERLVPMDIVDLGLNCQRYALFTNDTGGILDDLMVSNLGDHLFMVVNAACKSQDINHLRTYLGDRIVEELSDRALLALQGPEAGAVMARLAPPTANLVFMTCVRLSIDGVDCFVSRAGYTGEDGFEISVPAEHAEALARTLLEQEAVAPVGLGARDSLRLEAGLCLYGHDIDTSTTPVEASLVWALSKVRRKEGARAGGFPGAEVIFEQLASGAARKRVGILPEGKAPVREGSELVSDGDPVGIVTSGGFGPTIGRPVAMGYIQTEYARPETNLEAMVRDKPRPVQVAKLPFVQQRYYRG